MVNTIRIGLLLAVMVALPIPDAQAKDEVHWRYDYASARAEAQRAGLPILLDFSTDWCTYCKKLDLTTFKDPAVAALLNAKFIAVKLDGTREKRLVEALRIQGYPTLVLAGPDGKILKTIEGYVDAQRFHAQLQEVLSSAANSEWMTKAYQDAVKANSEGDHSRAIALLKGVVDDGRQHPVQVQARRLLLELEQQANGILARARQLEESGRYLEALEALTGLTQSHAGSQAATEAAKLLPVLAEKPVVKTQQRSRRAAALLAQARIDLRDEQLVCCVERCAQLTRNYADLPEGTEALQLLEQIKANPEALKTTCETLADRLGEMYLAMAESWIRKGETQLAVECLERVAGMSGSKHAEIAKTRLTQIRGRAAVSTDAAR